ncbi:hypothetical protein BD626DRAFT_399757 [Schizophyllum amplum]|uniref:Uncharacterized protein n=1 Tax=Schizophyllum amplum TaxID=97359 RepID=A0A550CJ98_9AGAR|nr:hypothetical protein BD626DRAFT_399757 [Auriculariopsis ampla]
MGRTQLKTKLRRKVFVDETHRPAAPAPTVDALLEKAQTLIVQCDYELARKFIQRVLEQQPDNAVAKEMLGVAHLELGELAPAKEIFTSLVSAGGPSPPPSSAHLYLAQLSEGDPHEAIRHYQAAVDILSTQLKGKERATDENPDEGEVRKNIVGALIGQVEIWMDPEYELCFDPAAEKTCEELLASALQVDLGNSEALSSLASVRLSQQRPDEAKKCLEEAWRRWKDMDLDDDNLPPLASRLSMVKLFLELDMFNEALLTLNGIMAEDDQDVEAWYLEGWCFFLMAERARENGGSLGELTFENLARDSRDCLEACRTIHANQEHPDKALLEHAKELIQQLDAAGIKPSPLDEEGEGNDERDWEDEDSDDDDVQMQ